MIKDKLFLRKTLATLVNLVCLACLVRLVNLAYLVTPPHQKKAAPRLLSQDAAYILENLRDYTLISTSTPLGSSSFINASTVFSVEL